MGPGGGGGGGGLVNRGYGNCIGVHHYRGWERKCHTGHTHQ